MSADTQYVLRARLDRQIGPSQGGTFGIVNQDPTAEIWVTVETFGSGALGDVFYLRKQGETLTIDRSTLRHCVIEAKAPGGATDQYPATILLVDTDLTVSVTSLASAFAASLSITDAATDPPVGFVTPLWRNNVAKTTWAWDAATSLYLKIADYV